MDESPSRATQLRLRQLRSTASAGASSGVEFRRHEITVLLAQDVLLDSLPRNEAVHEAVLRLALAADSADRLFLEAPRLLLRLAEHGVHEEAVICIHQVHAGGGVLEGEEEDAFRRLLEVLKSARTRIHRARESEPELFRQF